MLKIKQVIEITVAWAGAGMIGVLALSVSGCGDSSQELNVGVVDFPIAYIKRSVLTDEEGVVVEEDIRDQTLFQPGADLYLRQRAAPSATEINITGEITGGLGDVRWVSASFDGTKLLFSLRLPDIEGVDDEDQPTWNIWEYDIAEAHLRRVISVDLFAEKSDDVAPHYLTDGRIVFSSARQSTARTMLVDEGKSGYSGLSESLRNGEAMVLHVMRADGTRIEQISFNQSHDLTPTVLRSGEILYSRWDGARRNGGINLYKINPDGTNLQLIYGGHSHDNGGADDVQFMRPKEMPDGRILVASRPFESSVGDNLVFLDVENYSDKDKPLVDGMGGSAESPATIYDVSFDGLSLGGRFSAAAPLWDGSNRALISWSPCRLIEGSRIVPCNRQTLPEAEEAPPLYGVFIYDFSNDTQLPVVIPKEGVIYSDIVAAQPRDVEYFSAPAKDPALVSENVGILHIRSVYDRDGVFDDMGARISGVDSIAKMADPRVAPVELQVPRFIRLVKGVAVPDRSVLNIPRFAYGVSRANLMRDIIAYAPVEPDGSVKIKVPANVAFTIEVLDERGHRVSENHRNWMQVRPGEVLTCNGCHDHDSGQAHGRKLAERSINYGAQTSGVSFNEGTVDTMIAEMGESMAETRIRESCGTDLDILSCPELSPKMNLTYDDIWTDTVKANRAAVPSFNYRYEDLNSEIPTRAACLVLWEAGCRITINYETHIHPLWSLPRVDSVAMTDHTCTNCHNSVDTLGVLQLPAGQLDLSDGPSVPVSGRFQAYQELFVQDQEQAIVDGMLIEVFVLVPALDELGEQIVDAEGQPVPDVPEAVNARRPAMAVSGARRSYFMEKMLNEELRAGRSLSSADAVDYVDHRGMLSDVELKLIAEWLDLGGQYYNNPFDIPVP